MSHEDELPDKLKVEIAKFTDADRKSVYDFLGVAKLCGYTLRPSQAHLSPKTQGEETDEERLIRLKAAPVPEGYPANWHNDSSLKTWFPFTHEELERLKSPAKPPEDVQGAIRPEHRSITATADDIAALWDGESKPRVKRDNGEVAEISKNVKFLYESLLPHTERKRYEINEAYYSIIMGLKNIRAALTNAGAK
jgi:hypothetical protein